MTLSPLFHDYLNTCSYSHQSIKKNKPRRKNRNAFKMDPTIDVDVHDRSSRSKVRPSDSRVLFQCYSCNAITCKTTYSCCYSCKTNCSRIAIEPRRKFLSVFLDAHMIRCSGSDHDRAQEEVAKLPHGSFGLPCAFSMLLQNSMTT